MASGAERGRGPQGADREGGDAGVGRAGIGSMAAALIWKYIGTAVLAWVSFGLLVMGNTWTQILVLALIVTIVNYFVADMLVLRAGSWVAAILEGLIAAGVAWLMTMGMIIKAMMVTTTALIVFGVAVAVGELLFHMYLPRPDRVGPSGQM